MRCSKTLNTIKAQFEECLSTTRSSPLGFWASSPRPRPLHPKMTSTRTRLLTTALCMVSLPVCTSQSPRATPDNREHTAAYRHDWSVSSTCDATERARRGQQAQDVIMSEVYPVVSSTRKNLTP